MWLKTATAKIPAQNAGASHAPPKWGTLAQRRTQAESKKYEQRQRRFYGEIDRIEVPETAVGLGSEQVAWVSFGIMLENIANAGVKFRRRQTDIREEHLAKGKPVRGPDNQEREGGGAGKRREPPANQAHGAGKRESRGEVIPNRRYPGGRREVGER